jgi:hypothetical protein
MHVKPAILVLGLVCLAACGPSEQVRQQMAELQAVAAEKDSLLIQVAENARLMSEISAEVARVQAPAGEAGTQEVAAQDPDAIRESIRNLTDRIQASEDRLAQSQQRVTVLARETRTQQTRLTELQKAIQDFQATIGNQKLTIESLTEQVDILQTRNAALAEQNAHLATTVDVMTMRENTVYYVVGTKQELLEKGIIAEEGGSRVLFVLGKKGKTLVPGRDLDLASFNSIDKSQVTAIPLPSVQNERYSIVTRQDLSALESQPDDDGRFSGELRIADPDRFWAASRVLIVVES